MAHDADAQPLDVAGQGRAVVGQRVPRARRVLRVVAGDRLQQDRAILDGPGHRPGVVEAVRIGIDPVAADETIGRLQPDDAAKCRRAADRAAGVGAERRRDKPGRDRRPRAARRATGEDARGSTGCAPAATAGRSSARHGRIHGSRACRSGSRRRRRAFAPSSHRRRGRCRCRSGSARWCGCRRSRRCP